MKRINILKSALILVICFYGTSSFFSNILSEEIRIIHGDIKTESFKVYGNCGMCEKTIEGSLDKVKGIEKADWNKETKMISVSFDNHIITLEEIKRKIAAVGYDTEEYRASEKAYNELPGCCQYERPEESKSEEHNHEGHKH